MILLFKLIAITVIWVLGIKIATSEGMILEKLGRFAEKKVDEGHKIWDGLVWCQWCLPSFHSVPAHFFAFGLGVIPFEVNKELFIRWPLVIMGSSLVSGLIWTIYLTINKVKERNEEEWEYFRNLNQQDEKDIN